MIGAGGKLIQSVSEECGGVSIKFPPPGKGSEKSSDKVSWIWILGCKFNFYLFMVYILFYIFLTVFSVSYLYLFIFWGLFTIVFSGGFWHYFLYDLI